MTVCVFVTESERQTDRQTDRRTGRQGDRERQTGRQADRQTDRETEREFQCCFMFTETVRTIRDGEPPGCPLLLDSF